MSSEFTEFQEVWTKITDLDKRLGTKLFARLPDGEVTDTLILQTLYALARDAIGRKYIEDYCVQIEETKEQAASAKRAVEQVSVKLTEFKKQLLDLDCLTMIHSIPTLMNSIAKNTEAVNALKARVESIDGVVCDILSRLPSTQTASKTKRKPVR